MPAPLDTYRAKRDFSRTAEPAPRAEARPARLAAAPGPARMFVVQKHAARRAGLHWDFRLEHDGVLWSWAVPKGPSLDPADKRMAVHVEDHPIEYADFQGGIPEGEYGAGNVQTWDRGTWEALDDPAVGMAKGHLHFVLRGGRLNGRFSLVRAGRQGSGRPEAWFLMKSPDEHAAPGQDAAQLEAGPPPRPDAVRTAPLPTRPQPQLCMLVDAAPEGEEWLSEIKLDGYRILPVLERGTVRLTTRNGLDWSARMPALAAAFARIDVRSAVLDGELVALEADGRSSFPALQAALKEGRDKDLAWFGFDLLHLNGEDWTGAPLLDRKAALRALGPWTGMLRFSDHVVGNAAAIYANACGMGLEGIVCKRAGAPYRAGRGRDWVKVKCLGREEFIVLGFTPPAGSREGLGALQVGYRDEAGQLHYAGAVGSGFNRQTLEALRRRLDAMQAAAPDMLVAGDPVDTASIWVRPELVAEVEFIAWSGAGRIRHPVFLGLREDKPASEIVRPPADPGAKRTPFIARSGPRRRGWHGAVPPLPPVVPMPAPKTVAKAGATPAPAKTSRIVTAKKPKAPEAEIGAVHLSHPDRPLWPGITKLDLARYWQEVAPHALPGIALRPLSILRCPGGIEAEKFFQKNGHGHLPHQIREAHALKQPYLAIDDADGLFALAQMSAIELHAWGAPEADPARPDTLVFDLDPGDGVAFPDVVRAALEVRDRLQRLNLQSLCRTTGGKGLHVVVPLRPEAGWDTVKPFCRAFAETMAKDAPDRYVAHLKIADRAGRILVDWLRNGLGSTAVASFSPRARPGAGVATPLAWSEVTPKLDPARFTVLTVPKRLAKQKDDPWAARAAMDQVLPRLAASTAVAPATPARGTSRIVTARKPRPTSRS